MANDEHSFEQTASEDGSDAAHAYRHGRAVSPSSISSLPSEDKDSRSSSEQAVAESAVVECSRNAETWRPGPSSSRSRLALPGEARLPERGDVLGSKYEIVQCIGAGAMGVVYEARHIRLNQRLAMKVARPELATSCGSLRAQFDRDAAASGAPQVGARGTGHHEGSRTRAGAALSNDARDASGHRAPPAGPEHRRLSRQPAEIARQSRRHTRRRRIADRCRSRARPRSAARHQLAIRQFREAPRARVAGDGSRGAGRLACGPGEATGPSFRRRTRGPRSIARHSSSAPSRQCGATGRVFAILPSPGASDPGRRFDGAHVDGRRASRAATDPGSAQGRPPLPSRRPRWWGR